MITDEMKIIIAIIVLSIAIVMLYKAFREVIKDVKRLNLLRAISKVDSDSKACMILVRHIDELDEYDIDLLISKVKSKILLLWIRFKFRNYFNEMQKRYCIQKVELMNLDSELRRIKQKGGK